MTLKQKQPFAGIRNVVDIVDSSDRVVGTMTRRAKSGWRGGAVRYHFVPLEGAADLRVSSGSTVATVLSAAAGTP